MLRIVVPAPNAPTLALALSRGTQRKLTRPRVSVSQELISTAGSCQSRRYAYGAPSHAPPAPPMPPPMPGAPPSPGQSAPPYGQPPYGDPYGSGFGAPTSAMGRPAKRPDEYILRIPINKGINIVPQAQLWVVERFGKYKGTLDPGLRLLLPVIDRIAYVHSTKEQAHEIPNQSAITADNVVVSIDGILFMRIVDAHAASYNIENPIYNLICVAQTTMRSEIGKLTLDRLFEERDALNQRIRLALSKDAEGWGVECKRYEIRDIVVSDIVRRSMDLQAQADRHRRKVVLESEGDRDAMTNRAEGERRVRIAIAEAEKEATVLAAQGEAERIRVNAAASAEGINVVAGAIAENKHSNDAMSLDVARRYVDAFSNIAKENNTVVLPADLRDPSAMVAQALAVYQGVGQKRLAEPPAAANTATTTSSS